MGRVDHSFTFVWKLNHEFRMTVTIILEGETGNCTFTFNAPKVQDSRRSRHGTLTRFSTLMQAQAWGYVSGLQARERFNPAVAAPHTRTVVVEKPRDPFLPPNDLSGFKAFI